MIGIQAREAAAIFILLERIYMYLLIHSALGLILESDSTFTGQNKYIKTEIPPTPYKLLLRENNSPLSC